MFQPATSLTLNTTTGADGTHAVSGTTTSGRTFQCSFNKKGTKVVEWFAAPAPKGCPAAVSEADRYKYPDCN